jgi:PilZ domain-containing protein
MLLEREMSMMQPPQERRTMRRFDMRLPAAVRLTGVGGGELLTETQNISARGVFFYLDRALAEGTPVEVTMTFPPHVTLTNPVRVRFSARIIRVDDPLPSQRVGVAAMIEEYEFLRSSQTPDLLGPFRQRKASN